MRLIQEIRHDIVEPRSSLASVRRKTRLLAQELAAEELIRWVQDELNGYPDGRDVPAYRRLAASSVGFFAGPFGRAVDNYPIPLSLLPDNVREFASQVVLKNPVAEIEDMAARQMTGHERWPPEAVLLVRDKLELSGGFVLIDARKILPSHALRGVLDSIQNRLLEFIITLEGISVGSDSEDPASEMPREAVLKAFHTTVYGDRNVIAIGPEVTQNFAIKPGNEEALVSALQSASTRPISMISGRHSVRHRLLPQKESSR